MSGQERRIEATGLGGLALAALRAEMEALALLLPGAYAAGAFGQAADRSAAKEDTNDSAESRFDTLPV